jgi:hypothetical protein
VIVPLSTRTRARGTRPSAELLNGLQLLATSFIAKATSTSLRLRGCDADLVRTTDGRVHVDRSASISKICNQPSTFSDVSYCPRWLCFESPQHRSGASDLLLGQEAVGVT